MRKSLLFGLAAASSLALSAPLFAQSDQTPTAQPQAPSTTSSTSSSSSTTVTGTVVSSSDNELVIDTATGRQRFVVESGTSDIPANLAPGTEVTVEFKALSGDQRQVSRVTASPGTGASSSSSSTSSSRPSTPSTSPSTSSTSPSTPSTPSTTTPSRSGDPTMSAEATRDADVTAGDDRDRRAGTTDNDRDDDALPATASPVGLVGLLGLLSLGASAALRAWRRLF